jgi:eukaryotic-like serine/threonine-protein kinase
VSKSDAPRTVGGQLSTTPPAEVLKVLETKEATVRVHFDTEIGRGEIDVVRGKIVDAMLGDLFGRQALLSLLGVSEGHYSTSELSNSERSAAEPRPPLCPSIDQLLADRARRIGDWRRLSEQMPPLSSGLRLSPDGEAKLPKQDLAPPQRRLLPLLDGRRTIADLVDESGLDAVDAFAILVEWLRAGLILELPGPEMVRREPFQIARPSPRPPAPEAGQSTGGGPLTPAAVVPSTPGGGPRRRTTVIGMGIPAPEPVRPRRAEVHKMISVGTPSMPPPAEVGRIRTVSAMPAPIPIVKPTPAGGLAAATTLREGSPPGGVHGAPVEPAPPSAGEAAVERARAGARRAVGRYEVIARIGHGGMGSVYLARLTSETGFRRFFALKLLRQHLLDDAAAANNFLEEARLAGFLHHPNAVSVVDAGIDGTQPYLVMDYVEGGSLKQLVAAHPIGRPAELIVPIVLDALAGLHAVHTLTSDDGAPLNIVHCDVSPENLLVGVDGICRLTDFGVARRQSAVGERLAHGKPGYLAPEQVLRRAIDRRVDVFTMGIVLYNTLTGIKLFDAGTVEETLERVCSEPIPPPSTVGLGPPPCFDFICMKALERDPNRRYATAEDMASELRRVALREGLLAPTASVAAWVRTCIGKELDQRRLLVLDVSRRPALADPHARTMISEAPPPLGASARPPSVMPPGAVPIEEPPPDGDGEPTTGTVPLDFGRRMRRWVLIVAALLAAAAVGMTLVFPGKISKFFEINTAGVRSEGIDLSLESALPPNALVPSASSEAPGLRVPAAGGESRWPAGTKSATPAPSAPPAKAAEPD